EAQRSRLIQATSTINEAAHRLRARAREACQGLGAAVTRGGDPTRSARLAAWRAQALFHAVSGTDQVLILVERYEKAAAGQAPDGWIDLAIPEYAANARVSDELMTQALARLEDLHRHDSTFLRTYVLQARLHLIKKDLDGATASLDQVLTMRKEHD